jgi:hypothetical protein
MLGAEMSMETEAVTWFFGFTSKIWEFSAEIVRQFSQDKFLAGNRSLVRVQLRQQGASNSDETSR